MEGAEAAAGGVEDEERGVSGKLEARVPGVPVGEPYRDELLSQDVADEVVGEDLGLEALAGLAPARRGYEQHKGSLALARSGEALIVGVEPDLGGGGRRREHVGGESEDQGHNGRGEAVCAVHSPSARYIDRFGTGIDGLLVGGKRRAPAQ